MYMPVVEEVSSRNILIYGSTILVCIAIGVIFLFTSIFSFLKHAGSTKPKQQNKSYNDDGTTYLNYIGTPNIHSSMEAHIYQNH